MRRPLLLALLSCTACPAVGIGSDCDEDKLEELSASLETMSGNERRTGVVRGLREACGESIPEIVYAYYEPVSVDGSMRLAPLSDEAWKMKEKACPAIGEVMESVANAPARERATILFERCDFARYKVIRADEVGVAPSIVTWAMHQFLLDQGLSAQQVAPLTRALFDIDRLTSSGMNPTPDLTFPEATGHGFEPGVAIHVSPRVLIFNDEKLVRLEAGVLDESAVRNHLISPLYDRLAEEADRAKQMAEATGSQWDGHAILAADAGTPFATIVDVMFTAGRAEYSRYSFVVSPPNGAIARIPVEPPKFSLKEPRRGLGLYAMGKTEDGAPAMARNFDPDMAAERILQAGEPEGAEEGGLMSIELATDRVTLSRGPEAAEPTVVDVGDLNAIADYAAELKQRDPKAHRLAVSAEGDVPLSAVVSAIAAARGPECQPDGSQCVLPDVTVLSADAHGYGRPQIEAVGNPELDEDVWGGLPGVTVSGSVGVGESTGFARPRGPIPRVRQEKAKVKGQLDADIVRRIVRAHINEVRYCYNDGLTKNSKLKGKIGVDFVIGDTGRVISAKLGKSTLDDEEVGVCLTEAFKRWKFPRPRDGGQVSVTQNFDLRPG